jgi:hypothetical protein
MPGSFLRDGVFAVQDQQMHNKQQTQRNGGADDYRKCVTAYHDSNSSTIIPRIDSQTSSVDIETFFTPASFAASMTIVSASFVESSY